MYAILMVTWIPSIYLTHDSHVSIYIPAPWILWDMWRHHPTEPRFSGFDDQFQASKPARYKMHFNNGQGAKAKPKKQMN